jgi:hypothetical protein
MEIVDNAIMVAIPGAMDASLTNLGFWAALAAALLIAGAAAYPANRWLRRRARVMPSCMPTTARRTPTEPWDWAVGAAHIGHAWPTR